MIKQATGHGLVPPEPHGLWDHNLLEVFLTKTFFNNMMRQRCSTEAGGHMCYDKVVRNYGSMLWQTFGVPECVAIFVPMEIQLMWFFL